MKKTIISGLILCGILSILAQVVEAENIWFNDISYELKTSDITKTETSTDNEYFNKNESNSYWTSKINIKYYPKESSSITLANKLDKEISNKEDYLLLKFVQNKKKNIAIISYLQNVIQDNQTFFIYNVNKYEKHPKKGIISLQFSKKYVFSTKEEITKIGHEIKEINNDYIEKIIITPIPNIVEN